MLTLHNSPSASLVVLTTGPVVHWNAAVQRLWRAAGEMLSLTRVNWHIPDRGSTSKQDMIS